MQYVALKNFSFFWIFFLFFSFGKRCPSQKHERRELGIFPACSGIPTCTLTIISPLSSEYKPWGKKTVFCHLPVCSPPSSPLEMQAATRCVLGIPKGPRKVLPPGAWACLSCPRFTAFGVEKARSVLPLMRSVGN